MAKECEICGKKAAVGNNVSHSVRRTKRRFLPNIVKKKIYDPIKKMFSSTKICTRCLRTKNKVEA